MSSAKKLGIVIYPKDRDFQLLAGGTVLGSRQYASSSNTYRGARAAARNIIKNRGVSNDTNYGSNIVAVVNKNNFVIAASNEYSKPGLATKAVQKVLETAKGIKKIDASVSKD